MFSDKYEQTRTIMMDEEALKYWIALKSVEEVGCVGFRHLLAAFSSPQMVFAAPAQVLQAIPGIGPKTANHIRSFQGLESCRTGGQPCADTRCGDRHLPGPPLSKKPPEYL